MQKRSLYEEISGFRRAKKFIAIPLIIIGLLGLVLPIIPGTVLILIGILFLFPKDGEKLVRKIKRVIGK